MNEDRCFYSCGACGHVHFGYRSNYACPYCSCNSHEVRDEGDAA